MHNVIPDAFLARLATTEPGGGWLGNFLAYKEDVAAATEPGTKGTDAQNRTFTFVRLQEGCSCLQDAQNQQIDSWKLEELENRINYIWFVAQGGNGAPGRNGAAGAKGKDARDRGRSGSMGYLNGLDGDTGEAGGRGGNGGNGAQIIIQFQAAKPQATQTNSEAESNAEDHLKCWNVFKTKVRYNLSGGQGGPGGKGGPGGEGGEESFYVQRERSASFAEIYGGAAPGSSVSDSVWGKPGKTGARGADGG